MTTNLYHILLYGLDDIPSYNNDKKRISVYKLKTYFHYAKFFINDIYKLILIFNKREKFNI